MRTPPRTYNLYLLSVPFTKNSMTRKKINVKTEKNSIQPSLCPVSYFKIFSFEIHVLYPADRPGHIEHGLLSFSYNWPFRIVLILLPVLRHARSPLPWAFSRFPRPREGYNE